MRDAFASFHPLVTMLYFLLVLTLTMLLMHPVSLGISFISALGYAVYLNGREALRFGMVFLLPMLLLTALLNPLFNHEGATVLTYFSSGNPLTAESIFYGLAAALMLAAVISWFSCFNTVMTTDKLVYLLGRVMPGLSLILAMALRFVPRFKAQIGTITGARQCLGRPVAGNGLVNRAREGMRTISILVTWALENAVETAAGMRGRGYGLPGRTAFSIFRFNRRDGIALTLLFLGGAYIGAGVGVGGLYFRYYPTIKSATATPYTVSLFIALAALCLMPLAINITEDLRWKATRSKI